MVVSGLAAFLAPLFGFYDAVFQPVLAAGPYVSLVFFSVILAALFSIIYWLLLDIERADEIKDKLDKYQDKMKEARENDKEDKASDHLKKTLHLNQKFMMLNLKPMLATMVFVGLFFPWLGATYAPTIQMDQTNNSTYQGNLSYAGQQAVITAENTTEGIEVHHGKSAALKDGKITVFDMQWQFAKFNTVQNSEHDANLKLSAEFISLPFSLPFAGDVLNWLGFYIIIMMPLTYIFRKLLGVQ